MRSEEWETHCQDGEGGCSPDSEMSLPSKTTFRPSASHEDAPGAWSVPYPREGA